MARKWRVTDWYKWQRAKAMGAGLSFLIVVLTIAFASPTTDAIAAIVLLSFVGIGTALVMSVVVSYIARLTADAERDPYWYL